MPGPVTRNTITPIAAATPGIRPATRPNKTFNMMYSVHS